jgi:glycosyltransferase involved in cell wall biosynthesis
LESNFKVSVIVPNYNRKDSLVKAVRSVLEQTYTPWEVIVVDDGSGFDISGYLGNAFKKEYDEGFLIVVVNEENCGAGKSRNIGVDKSSGEYVAFLDSDDYWAQTKLNKQIKKFKVNPDLDLVYCDQFLVIDGVVKESNKKMVNSDLLGELVNGWTAPNTSTLMYKKKPFRSLSGFDGSLKSCQDHDLWFRTAIGGFRVDFVDEPLSFFVLDSSDRISNNVKNRMDGVYKFLENCRRYLPDSEYRNFRSQYICKTSLPLLIKSVKEKRFAMALRIYFKYLALNSLFYKKILNNLWRSL